MQGYKKGANISDVYKIRSLRNKLSAEEISNRLRISLDVVQSHINGFEVLESESKSSAKKKRGRPPKSDMENGVSINE